MKKLVILVGLIFGAVALAVAPVRADSPSSSPCVFEEGMTASCQSTNAQVTLNDISIGDTSGCTFQAHVDWGDEQTSDSAVFPGGPDHSVVYAPKHTYASPGTYTITIAGQVISGSGCSFGVRTYSFTLAAPVGTLITSPTDGKIIAMTNSTYLTPQPAVNERSKPEDQKRSLLVKGKNPCGDCTIKVNGRKAKKQGDTWEVALPKVGPGELTITAQASAGQADSIKITLIDLIVANPTENQSVPLTDAPAMPDLNATGKVLGLPQNISLNAANLAWQLQVHNRWVQPKDTDDGKVSDWHDDSRVIAEGTTTGLSAWHPDYHGTILGGWAKLQVTATIPGVDGQVVSEPRWFDMPGGDPGKDSIKQYIRSHTDSPRETTLATGIAYAESAFHQFTDKKKNFGKKLPQSVPSDWKANEGWVRPKFGPPAGVGIMQLDPAPFPDVQWNWHTNIEAGIANYRSKKAEAAGYADRTQTRLSKDDPDQQQVLQDLLQRANENRAKKHQPKLTLAEVPVIVVPQLTPTQLEREGIRRYNGGAEYVFNARYKLSESGLNIIIVGDKWETAAHKDPGYVDRVIAHGEAETQ